MMTVRLNWRDQLARVLPAIGALAIFAVCVRYIYLGDAFASCTTTLTEALGDQTGLLWAYQAVSEPLWGQHTDVSNAPWGEDPWSPMVVANSLLLWLYWLAAKIFGPVCGYNVFTSVGFCFSAMCVYTFARSFARRWDVSVLAGFAAAFTPYLQVKTGVHSSYVFFGVFVIAIQIVIALWRSPSVPKSIALGLVVTSFFYTDVYFVLLGGVAVGSAAGALLSVGAVRWLRVRLLKRPPSRQMPAGFVRCVAISALISATLGLLPLGLLYNHFYASISSEVDAVRSPIRQEAMTYSAHVSEYLAPNPFNPYLDGVRFSDSSGLIRALLVPWAHGSNDAETTLSLSYMLMLFALVALAAMSRQEWRRYRGHSPREPAVPRLEVFVLCAVGTIAFLVSLPPEMLGVSMPSSLIISLTDIWRVFARLAVIVATCLALVAAAGVAYVCAKVPRRAAPLLVAVVATCVGFEYLTTGARDDPPWSFSQMHPFYTWLKQQPDVDTIAEYPLNEPGRTANSVYYFGTQVAHRKSTLNAYRANSPQTLLRNGLRDLSNPQTAPALAALGVDIVVVHAESREEEPARVPPGMARLRWDGRFSAPDNINDGGSLRAYRVTAAPSREGVVLVPGRGFDPIVRNDPSFAQTQYSLPTAEGELALVSLRTGLRDTNRCACRLRLRVYAPSDSVSLKQGSRVLWEGAPSMAERTVDVALTGESEPIRLQRANPDSGDVIVDHLDVEPADSPPRQTAAQ